MTRVMLDGISASAVKAAVGKQKATIVSGYVNGNWPDFAALALATPGLGHLSITVNASNLDAQCLDVEKNDASPDQAPGWALGVRKAGREPWVYMNASTWPAVKAAFDKAEVAYPHFWVAEYDENPTIPAGAVAKQHTNTLEYDISSVVDYVSGFDPDPFKGQMEDIDMPMIEPLTDHPGEYSFGVDETAGLTKVRFNIDGYGHQVELRVVTWDKNGCHVHENVTIGGPTPAQNEHQLVVSFADAPSTYGVTVRRLDHTIIPIGVSFR